MDTDDVNSRDWLEYRPERCGGATDKGPRRADNQDAFWIPDQDTPTDLGALYLVADGVGGQQDGAVASNLAVETVKQVFYELRQNAEPIQSALKDALEKANFIIIEEAQKRQVRKMGSTFVAAVQDGDRLMVAHVGDARAYLIRQGELRQLTRDDTWVQRQVDAGLITEEEAVRHEFRNVVTQVLGNKPDINVNLSQAHVLQPEDGILLCSDGLYDVLPDNTLVSLAMENEPQMAVELLVKAAIEAEATDNITAVVMQTGKAPAFADEPTLAVLPIGIDSAIEEEAPQETIIAPPPKAPPPAKETGGISKWLIILAVLAILLIIAALVTFWLQNRNATENTMASATALPALIETPATESAGALRPLDPTPVAESEALEMTATATVPPPDTPTPLPTPTLEPTIEPKGCVNGELLAYVWSDAQINSGCGPTSEELEVGQEVRILSEQPLSPGGGCGTGQFIQIQLVEDGAVEGWVHEASIDLITAGEACSP